MLQAASCCLPSTGKLMIMAAQAAWQGSPMRWSSLAAQTVMLALYHLEDSLQAGSITVQQQQHCLPINC